MVATAAPVVGDVHVDGAVGSGGAVDGIDTVA